jgi:hypothetical protein
MLVTEVVTNVVAVVVATGVIPNGEDITRAGESSRRRWYHHPYRHCFLFQRINQYTLHSAYIDKIYCQRLLTGAVEP